MGTRLPHSTTWAPLAGSAVSDGLVYVICVAAIRLHGLEAWRRCRLHSRFTIDFLRLSRQVGRVYKDRF